MPVKDGSWQIARRLMSGYEFADPSIVRAYYDPAVPLEQRDMLLKLQAFGLAHVFAGVRVGVLFERTREIGGSRARIWGCTYRTLDGHVEMGQMDWEVWKWLDDGRVRSASTPSPAPHGFPTRSSGSGSICCAAASAKPFCAAPSSAAHLYRAGPG